MTVKSARDLYVGAYLVSLGNYRLTRRFQRAGDNAYKPMARAPHKWRDGFAVHIRPGCDLLVARRSR